MSKRELHPWGLGFYLKLTVVNKGVEYSLLRLGNYWKQGFEFLIWSSVPYLVRGF